MASLEEAIEYGWVHKVRTQLEETGLPPSNDGKSWLYLAIQLLRKENKKPERVAIIHDLLGAGAPVSSSGPHYSVMGLAVAIYDQSVACEVIMALLSAGGQISDSANAPHRPYKSLLQSWITLPKGRENTFRLLLRQGAVRHEMSLSPSELHKIKDSLILRGEVSLLGEITASIEQLEMSLAIAPNGDFESSKPKTSIRI